ncbi:NmrA/HSCARG family protein [Aspergillus melleus]|uniref:NmrA/HSCARG family protein n=1 Tax=Aspergillus melleus TaxID=138277 RepID=UPI001E8ED811|nr:uncharacterized protein LDX57_011090 [Aspergillus melleus]KAH8433456.1 hypothetical protein LDX57_011090 [Aspergillus melleus]
MQPDPAVAFVTGATGAQGGATARQLLDAGAQVHALVRDTSSQAAIDLQARGARLFQGSFDDIAVLKAAMSRANAVFLNVLPSPRDPSLEVTYAKNIIDAAKAAGSVTTMVYSSVTMTGKHETFPNWGPEYPLAWYWTNKDQIEKMVRSAGFQHWTILRPAFLMDNYHQPKVSFMFPELVASHTFLTAYHPDTRMTVVDSDDVGKFATAAILEPSRFHGHEIDLGVESLSPAEIVRALSHASGKEVGLQFYSKDEAERIAARNPRIWADLWANDVGYQVNFEELDNYQIQMTSFSQYLQNQRGVILRTFGQDPTYATSAV